MSRLSHSQNEIEGILHCQQPSEDELSDSADELADPADQVPAAGPEPELRMPADQPDMEDMGALAQDLREAASPDQSPQHAGAYLTLCVA